MSAVSNREEIVAAFDAFREAVSGLADLSFDALTTPERLGLLERLEHDTRRLPVARHALINGVRQQASAAEIGGRLSDVLADRLGISRSDANRRIEEAADLGERRIGALGCDIQRSAATTCWPAWSGSRS